MNRLGNAIEIGSTRVLDTFASTQTDYICETELLDSIYLTDVFLFRRRLQFIVDAFPFLKRLLLSIYTFNQVTSSFVLDIGEGLVVQGRRSDSQEGFQVEIVNCRVVEESFLSTNPEVLLFLTALTSDLDKSIAALGLDTSLSLMKLRFQ